MLKSVLLTGVVTSDMESAISQLLRKALGNNCDIAIEGLSPIPGGFSRETFSCTALVTQGDAKEVLPLIIRKDPPEEVCILQTSRANEHELIESLRAHTSVPVSRSYGYELDPSVFGSAAMVLERADGNGKTSQLFNGGPDADQAEEVMRHLCEVLVELHQADISVIDPRGILEDPRGVGIRTSSWDDYMDSTFEYYLSTYDDIVYDPSSIILLDAYLTLRRKRPRPLRLSVVHGDFNPANFLYKNGKVSALIDWENSRIGDPREDLGWMTTMDILSNSHVMDYPKKEGGFISYYNKLTGWNVTKAEVDYFTLFGSANIGVPVQSAIYRRIAGEHRQFMHLYLIQSSAPAIPSMAQLLGYPGSNSSETTGVSS